MDFHFIFDGFSQEETEDITKCLTNILNIPEGSIPLARRLGVSWGSLSQVPPDMENDYATEIIEKIEEFEPRASVSDVSFSYGDGGTAMASIVLEKGDGGIAG